MDAYRMDILRPAQVQGLPRLVCPAGGRRALGPMAAAPGAHVEFRAARQNAAPLAVIGVCSAAAPCPQAQAVAGQFGAHGLLLLPPAAPTARRRLPFCCKMPPKAHRRACVCWQHCL